MDTVCTCVTYLNLVTFYYYIQYLQQELIKRYKTNFLHILDLATANLVAVYLEVFSRHNIFASIIVSSKNLFPNFNARTCGWWKYETQC